MNVLKKMWMVGVLAVALGAGCAEDELAGPGDEAPADVAAQDGDDLVSVDETADAEGGGARAATNCLVVEWCNAPERLWPNTGTLCRRKRGETCTYTQEKAECEADARYVCGRISDPYGIYTPL